MRGIRFASGFFLVLQIAHQLAQRHVLGQPVRGTRGILFRIRSAVGLPVRIVVIRPFIVGFFVVGTDVRLRAGVVLCRAVVVRILIIRGIWLIIIVPMVGCTQIVPARIAHAWTIHAWTIHAWTIHAWTIHAWIIHAWSVHARICHTRVVHTWVRHTWIIHIRIGRCIDIPFFLF